MSTYLLPVQHTFIDIPPGLRLCSWQGSLIRKKVVIWNPRDFFVRIELWTWITSVRWRIFSLLRISSNTDTTKYLWWMNRVEGNWRVESPFPNYRTDKLLWRYLYHIASILVGSITNVVNIGGTFSQIDVPQQWVDLTQALLILMIHISGSSLCYTITGYSTHQWLSYFLPCYPTSIVATWAA